MPIQNQTHRSVQCNCHVRIHRRIRDVHEPGIQLIEIPPQPFALPRLLLLSLLLRPPTALLLCVVHSAQNTRRTSSGNQNGSLTGDLSVSDLETRNRYLEYIAGGGHRDNRLESGQITTWQSQLRRPQRPDSVMLTYSIPDATAVGAK